MPTPWSSWLIAGHPDRVFPDATNVFLARLTRGFTANSDESRATKNVAFIERNFGYPKKDIEVRKRFSSCVTQIANTLAQAWLKTVSYSQDCTEIPKNVIESTLRYFVKVISWQIVLSIFQRPRESRRG